ncbi:hypothetical protein I4I73_10855 [Pseudonocardia sp. KRD-184]|uniref:Uncharacterized protein n=1 Tax=Pseudonocardia oceani TaxID=2792013 RepID=A0ABS6UAP1_9PSEU|nr:hypothetical protein [Pseudonocardia oceani]MBW0089479.1 hypothetical protein [Pseudonocardia oceani]MBW0096487.1 hypothetical protein [Pseudonocardia oceani]MBW0109424.1 hypothetical protein [Pseudonocardia oceani]MBW0123330.1 hypothetical protein [Pseudonocardia oceani]MBW0129308.1 hypothetical protein [Pseudonocardia oceani]
MTGPRPGLSWPVLVGLAALAAPRVVLHDLGVVEEGTLAAGLLVVVPPACWVAAALWWRPPRPFATLVVVGALYGVLLAVGHQLLWNAAFDGPVPALGGALAGTDPALAEVLLRAAAVVSSLVTGTLVGVVTGAVALLLHRLTR